MRPLQSPDEATLALSALCNGVKWMKVFATALVCCIAAFSAGVSVAQKADAGLYVPTPQTIVDAMLDMAGVGATDHVIDLGSGDGRIVRTAARRLGATGVGVEIDDQLVSMAQDAAAKDGVTTRAQFVSHDLWTFDTSKASVVTVYLLPRALPRLKQKLLAELKPGTRVVAHDYPFPDWEPTQRIGVHEPAKLAGNGDDKAYLYLYVIPARN